MTFPRRYDDNGRVLWVRLFTGDAAATPAQMIANSLVADVSAMNDRAYVVGVQAGALYFHTCQFRTHSGGAGDALSENMLCDSSVSANFASLTSGGAAGVFAVAYDASGEVQWIKNYLGVVAAAPATTIVAACAAVSR